MVAVRDKTRQSLYFPASMITEIEREAKRLDRSTSWIVAKAWMLSRDQMQRLPAADSNDTVDGLEE